ncbi:IS3 family transposase [Streptosporangium sp. NPDC023615]|uniref:IS3 family transposase n=1 Tax=Streptosporangium sp. NPDC023615 TaxID=3154794 RepID=UPI0034129D9B
MLPDHERVGVSFSAWRNRPPSARTLRHAWLTDEIRQVHAASNSVYGGPRVHAELTMGRGIAVGHGAVTMLMHRAGIKGLPGNKRRRPVQQTPTAADLAERQFSRGPGRPSPTLTRSPTPPP